MQRLFNTASRLAGNSDDAADLLQETYLRAFRTFDNFRPGTNGKAWLFTILYSVFINRRRKAAREISLPVEELERRFDQAVADWPAADAGSPAPPGDPDWSPEIEAALEDLPEAFRATVLLVDVEELTYEEAAAAIGCPVGTLRSRLFRARRLLAVALAAHARRSGFVREEGP